MFLNSLSVSKSTVAKFYFNGDSINVLFVSEQTFCNFWNTQIINPESFRANIHEMIFRLEILHLGLSIYAHNHNGIFSDFQNNILLESWGENWINLKNKWIKYIINLILYGYINNSIDNYNGCEAITTEIDAFGGITSIYSIIFNSSPFLLGDQDINICAPGVSFEESIN